METNHLIKDCPGLNDNKSKEQEGEPEKAQSSDLASMAQSKSGEAGRAQQEEEDPGGRPQ
jgi:hypothetical protein